MGKRKRSRMVDVSLLNEGPSNNDRGSNAERVENEVSLSAAQAGSQSGSANGGSTSDYPNNGDNNLNEASDIRMQNEESLSAAQTGSQSGSANGGSISDNPNGDNNLSEGTSVLRASERVQNEVSLSAAQAGSQSGSANGGSTSDNPNGDNNLDEGSGTSSDKKQRGPTLMAHIWNQPKEKRIVVEWNKRWQPINSEACDLAYFLGTIARNPMLCSLSYNDWRLVPKQEKNQLLQIVKSKFIIPNQEAERYVLKSMGRKWSNHKTDVRLKHYEPNRLKSVNDIMNNHKPDFVPKDQWISMVSHWTSDKGRYRSDKNRESRSKQVMVHTAGSKSFARVTAEKTVDGVEPSRAHVYVDTHQDRKTHPKPMDKKSKEAVDAIREKLSELPNGKEITDGDVAWEGDIYSQVMKKIVGPERRGHVRGLGLGPKSLASISSTQCEEHIDHDHDQCSERMEFLEDENRRLKDEVTYLRSQILAELTRRSDCESSMNDTIPSHSTGAGNEHVTQTSFT